MFSELKKHRYIAFPIKDVPLAIKQCITSYNLDNNIYGVTRDNGGVLIDYTGSGWEDNWLGYNFGIYCQSGEERAFRIHHTFYTLEPNYLNLINPNR